MDISKQIKQVQQTYKTLKYSAQVNELSGELFISPLDSYNIVINLESYPTSFPHVYEVDERIPKKVERHIYTDTGSCCLTTKANAQIMLKTKIKTLKLFIEQIVVPYFMNNSYYELNGKYKTDEYSHNGLGVIEGYRDILKTTNDMAIAYLIYHRVNGKKLKIHAPCYCGSKQALKKCCNGKHDKAYRLFRLIEKDVLAEDFLNFFKPYLRL